MDAIAACVVGGVSFTIDQVSDTYDLAIGRDVAETVDYRGYPISVYAREQMIFKLLRYKSKLPFDLYKEALRSYRHIQPKLDMYYIQDLVLAAPRSEKIREKLQMEVL